MQACKFPILTFDETRLSASLGYVFDSRWLDPYESLLSMLWKFAHMNRLAGHVVVAHVAKRPGDPYAGVAATAADVDIGHVATTLRLAPKTVRSSMPRAGSQRPWCPDLRFCPRCMARGYHGVVHQLGTQPRCPVHGNWLQTACSSCGLSSAYRLDALVLGAPFRCAHCRSPYSRRTTGFVHRPALSKPARAAITRALIG